MKITSKLSPPALALLFVVAIATAPARAQTGTEGKIILPPTPPPPSTQASPLPPSPLPAKAVADKLAPAGWTRYEIGEPARFSLLLPAAPESSVEQQNDLFPGVSVTTRTYLSSTDSGVYGATFVDDLPAAIMNEEAKQTFFEGFVSGFAQGFQEGMKAHGASGEVRMLDQRAARASGLAGYEQGFSFETLTGRVRLVFEGRRAYAVMAFWNALSTNSERDTFFASLKVKPKR